MLRSRLFLKIFLSYGLLFSALLLASVLLEQSLAKSDSALLQSPWFLTLILLIIALVVSYLMTRVMIAPLVRLAGAARALTKLQEPIDGTSRDEIRTLAQVIDSLQDELQQQLTRHDQERDLSRTVLRRMIESVIVLDPEEKVQFVNEAACRLLKFQASAVVGRKLWEVIRHRSIMEAAENALRNDVSMATEQVIDLPADRKVKVQATKLTGTHKGGAVLVLHDVTDMHRLERMRQDFFSNVSHELKTPLAAIQATVETLLDGALHDPKHNMNFLGRINENVDRLNRLVNDLLELSRIETGQQTLDLTSTPLIPAMEACIQRLEHRAQARKQQLSLACDSEAVDAHADDLALDQILDNLVDNAIKYTPEGGTITLKVSQAAGQARIDIIDNGFGISEKDLPRIFERFYRADRARDRQDPGTGLGLSIVKHLVQAQGGNIDVKSNLGQGSCFTVSLPAA
ncbi:MAG TPA: ATP-binding protein [Gemmatales bacterium]|nr:ATP-binding protein [Gemmatales bacterium]